MLTKIDLSQIDKIVGARIKKELTDYPAKADLTRELKPIKEDIAQIRKDVKLITGFFDREYLELRRRVEKIEQHLGLSTS